MKEGWFGPVSETNLPRIGDILVAARDNFAIVDSRHWRPQLLALLGVHGSLTHDESAVPSSTSRRATAPRLSPRG